MVTVQQSPAAAAAPHSPRAAPRIAAGRRLYAVGDVHGRADLLGRLHGRIAADARAAPPATEKILVYLGDYVDRGPDSKAVVEALARPNLAGFERVHLKGNHEDMLLGFHDDGPGVGALWMVNGGAETLASYGVEVPLSSDIADLARARDDLRRLMPAAHLAFLRDLSRWHRDGGYLFVHAGIRPGIDIEAQREDDLLWIREGFLDCDDDFGHVVVHGHTPTTQPEVRDNRIGIDTGAFFSGRLTCLVLDGAGQRFLAT